MRILAIETSGRSGSLAALTGSPSAASLERQMQLDGAGRTARLLAPTLQQLLAEVCWRPADIELVAVAVGPGSFTGLRIGVTTAKTLAYAVNAQVIAVETMSVLAAQAREALIHAILDAQRQELFVAKFGPLAGDRLTPISGTSIVAEQIWLESLRTGDYVTGPPLARLRDRLPPGVTMTPEEYWQPSAATVGQLAWQAYQNGRRDDLWQLTPHYYRLSAAEEKRGRQGEGDRRRV